MVCKALQVHHMIRCFLNENDLIVKLLQYFSIRFESANHLMITKQMVLTTFYAQKMI